MIVAKFGGSSLANANQFKKVKSIINANQERNVIVVSAIGKDINNPVKLTDQLIKIYNLKHANLNYQFVLDEIEHRLIQMKSELSLDYPIESALNSIAKNIPTDSYADLVSRGEYLTAHLMADYLNFQMIDAVDCLVFKNNQIDYSKSQMKLFKLMKNDSIVIPGFYGINENQKIELMRRGGGDTSGAVIANLLNADKYENWTDVDGLRKADPKIISNACKINEVTYDELRALSYMGVSAFQDEAIQPIKEKNIPIEILNTNCPEKSGTFVTQNRILMGNNRLAGVAGKTGYTLINLRKYKLNQNIGLVIQLMVLMKQSKMNYSYIPVGNDEISLLLSNFTKDKLDYLINQLKDLIHPESFIVKSNIALIGVISEEFRNRPIITGNIINQLRNNNILVDLITQGTDDIKITFGVNDNDYQKVIRCLYNYVNNDEVFQSLK